MRRILVGLLVCLALLYGVRYALQQGVMGEEEWSLRLREGAEKLQQQLQSPEFREKVLRSLQEEKRALRDEASRQWETLAQLAEQGVLRLKGRDAETTKQFAQTVLEEARAEGLNIRFDEAKLSVPPPHWMIAVVTNLILLAWILLAIFALWGIARFLSGRHER